MKDNNQLLAQRIYDIENADSTQRKEWHKNNITKWELSKEIYMEKSEDCMCWYLWKYDDGKCEFGYFKVVPKMSYSR